MKWTLRILKKVMSKFRNPNKYEAFPTELIETKPMAGMKSITFVGVVSGRSGRYRVAIQFYDILFSKNPIQGFLPVEYNGQKVYCSIPRADSNGFRLKSEDPDFRFTFEKELYDEKLLIGNWRRYIRKTPPPPVGYPYRNKDGIPGYSYPVYSLMYHLIRARMLRQ